MPLESTMMIIDNSEYMRNGDYPPTRFDAQADAVNTIFQTKVDSNPENAVGVMTMAGKGPEILVTHTKELGHILKAVHDVSNSISGYVDIPTAINIAQLALKHRENKNLRQRIIVFVASPLSVDEKEMVRLAKKLKKNNVAVDVVAFGDSVEEEETKVLKAFVEATSSGDNSHILTIPPGPHLLSDAILQSPILAGDRGIPEEAMGDGVAAGGSGPSQFEFGVDPSLDPELAMALRMSMEEEAARQAAEEASRQAATQPAQAGTSSTTASGAQLAAAMGNDEDAMLAQAIAMSQGGGGDVEMENKEASAEQDEDMDEEEAIAKAIQMSMEGNDGKDSSKKS